MARHWFIGLAAAGLLVSAVAAGQAIADDTFSGFQGTWRGAGNVTYTGGQTEKLSCKAYYNPKNSGAELSIALSCASQSNKLELRANLNSASGKISGTWEERSFNSSGSIVGKSSSGKLTLTITGTLTGTMSISTGGGSQSVSINTDGTGFKSVSLKLSKT